VVELEQVGHLDEALGEVCVVQGLHRAWSSRRERRWRLVFCRPLAQYATNLSS
jgi:hypothetical protein